jgi:ABC-type sulfate transport system permease component
MIWDIALIVTLLVVVFGPLVSWYLSRRPGG